MLSDQQKLHRRACVRAFFGVSAIAIIAGCATYQPPAASDAEVATLEIDPNTPNLLFTSVDGQPVSSTAALLQFNRRDPIKLKPGTHSIGVEYSSMSAGGETRGFSTLEFDAEASKKYRVYQRSDAKHFVAWITNESGKTVSRVKPK